MKFGYIGLVVSDEKSFEIVYRGRTDKGQQSLSIL